jgi:hypothetical protein
VYPFGETVSRWIDKAQRNSYGDVVIGVTRTANPPSVYGAVYSAEDNRWTASEELNGGVAPAFYVYGLAIDRDRRAVVNWCPSTGTSMCDWSRFSGDTWLSGSGPAVDAIAATSDGLATGIVWDDALMGYVSRTQDLSTGTFGPAAPTSIPRESWIALPIASLGRVALFATRPTASGHEIIVSWKDGNSWGTPEPFASIVEYPSFAADSDEEGNIIFAWTNGDEIWSRIYQRAVDEWTRPLIIATTSPNPILGRPDITAGNAIVTFNTFDPDPSTWAAIYEPGVGWIENAIVRLDSEWTGGSVGATMDPRGNALAVWDPEQSDFQYRRYVAGAGWQARSSTEDRVNPYMLWSAVAPDGTILAAATRSEAIGSGAVPCAKRFE